MAKKKPVTASTNRSTSKAPTKAMKVDWITTKTEELDAQEKVFAKSVCEYESAHAEAAQAKKEMELQQQRLNGIVQDICAIKRGNFTPPLPFPAEAKSEKATGGDIGGSKPLTLLVVGPLKKATNGHYREGVGLTGNLVEKLSEACEGNTIADLEKMMKTKPNWHRDIKGFGEEAFNKTMDALLLFRESFPMPCEDDKSKPPTPEQTIADKLNQLIAINQKA